MTAIRRLAAFALVTVASASLVACSAKKEKAPEKDAAPTTQTSSAAGALVTPATLVFAVEGMTCNGCAAAINETVAKIDGVKSCNASFETGSATVEVADAALAAAIVKSIEGAGFEAKVQ